MIENTSKQLQISDNLWETAISELWMGIKHLLSDEFAFSEIENLAKQLQISHNLWGTAIAGTAIEKYTDYRG